METLNKDENIIVVCNNSLVDQLFDKLNSIEASQIKGIFLLGENSQKEKQLKNKNI